MRPAAREARNWGQLPYIVIAGLIVGCGVSSGAKLIAPVIVQARTPAIEAVKAYGKPVRSSIKGHPVDL